MKRAREYVLEDLEHARKKHARLEHEMWLIASSVCDLEAELALAPEPDICVVPAGAVRRIARGRYAWYEFMAYDYDPGCTVGDVCDADWDYDDRHDKSAEGATFFEFAGQTFCEHCFDGDNDEPSECCLESFNDGEPLELDLHAFSAEIQDYFRKCSLSKDDESKWPALPVLLRKK